MITGRRLSIVARRRVVVAIGRRRWRGRRRERDGRGRRSRRGRPGGVALHTVKALLGTGLKLWPFSDETAWTPNCMSSAVSASSSVHACVWAASFQPRNRMMWPAPPTRRTTASPGWSASYEESAFAPAPPDEKSAVVKPGCFVPQHIETKPEQSVR